MLPNLNINSTFLLVATIWFLPLISNAQISPDGTTSTTVTTEGNVSTINDGDRAGGNLFHSFQDFSIPNGNQAFFNNAADVINIFSRVTGGNISNIDGLISANNANLFLINPAGVVFGSGASLDIGGSFYGSTADSIVFEDGEFSATDIDSPPLLTINAPIGLNFRDNPGTIVNNGANLSVVPDATIALIGGKIDIKNNGTLFAPGGRIELGSVAGNQIVNLTPLNNVWSSSYEEVENFGDIELSQSTIINTSGVVGGDVQIQGENITLREGARILANTDGNSSDSGAPGIITIDATDRIRVDDSSGIFSNVNPEAVGDAGEIEITTGSLNVTNGGRISATTFGQGNAGLVTINATDAVQVDGEDTQGEVSRIVSDVNGGAVGNAQGVEITSGSLEVRNGGLISATTRGQGNAGLITIDATENITLDGEDSQGSSSGLFSDVNDGAVGNSGGIDITTGSLDITTGARVSATTRSQGNAGLITINATDSINLDGNSSLGLTSGIVSQSNLGATGNSGDITINANSLNLTNGGRISASTAARGNAGSININTTESIKLRGISQDERFPFPSSILTDAAELDGNGGGINLVTDRLTIDDGARIEASNFPVPGTTVPIEPGTGEPGDINIKANSIRLTNGRIDTATQSQTGDNANISLQVFDDLILRDNSVISARALKDANGGNIDIDADFIVAFPSQFDGNDILASAERGVGGNINITTKGIFGIEVREQNPLTNDINASSEFSLDGTVTINNPDINALQGVVRLPRNVIESEETIAQVCSTEPVASSSSLVIKGQGGIPPQPTEALTADSIIIGGKSSPTESENRVQTTPEKQYPPLATDKGNIYPARGVVVQEDGTIVLTAYPVSNNTQHTLVASQNCQANR